MLGLIEVRLLNHTPQCVESFHQMLSEVDAILDAWKTTGDADYLLRVTVPDTFIARIPVRIGSYSRRSRRASRVPSVWISWTITISTRAVVRVAKASKR